MDALKQMINGVKVVGKLKTKNLKYDEDNKGIAIIRGNVVVEVKNGDKLNNIYLNVYTKHKQILVRKMDSIRAFKLY